MFDIFLKHKTAANIIMATLLIIGSVSLYSLNIQNFPTVKPNVIMIYTSWFNASPSEVEENITIPMEAALRTVDGIDMISSYTEQGISEIAIDLDSGTDYNLAFSEINKIASSMQDLPVDSLPPNVTQVLSKDHVLTIALRFTNTINKEWVYQFESELKTQGVTAIESYGLPEEDFIIEIKESIILSSGMPVEQWIGLINKEISKETLGLINNDEQSINIKADNRIKTVDDLKALFITLPDSKVKYPLDDIAVIEKIRKGNDIEIFQNGKSTVLLKIYRTSSENIFDIKDIATKWLESKRDISYKDLEIVKYDDSWMAVKERIGILVENGVIGLILVMLVLNWALSGRVALWVSVGIPVAFFGGFILMSFFGMSINMISIFGLIMVLGIVVDDAIVVGEQYETEREDGFSPFESAKRAAEKMWKPVLVSTLTTFAAFIPLLYMSGEMGQIGKVIPIVVISVVLISLIEAFLLLPAHLSTEKNNTKNATKSVGIDKINLFYKNYIESKVIKSLNYRKTTLSLSVVFLLVVVGLLYTGIVKYSFFGTSMTNEITAYVEFDPSTTIFDKRKLHDEILVKYEYLNDKYPEKLIHMTSFFNMTESFGPVVKGADFMQITFYLRKDDKVSSGLKDSVFTQEIADIIGNDLNVNNYNVEDVKKSQIGESSDIALAFSGESTENINIALLKLKDEILKDLRFSKVKLSSQEGREEWFIEINELAKAKGVELTEIVSQVKSNSQGHLIDRVHKNGASYDIIIRGNQSYSKDLEDFYSMPIKVGDIFVPLSKLVNIKAKKSPTTIYRGDGMATVSIEISIDQEKWTTAEAMKNLETHHIPNILKQGDIAYELSGVSKNQLKTKNEVITLVVIAIALIYLVLCLFFQNYSTPLLVLSIIPFACAGAILGHLALGLNVSVMSSMAMFGLAGIVVNDSIILIQKYQDLCSEGLLRKEAITLALEKRFRAIVLTSITTIAGLTPLLFESSLEAQFLVPMAASMVFGLMTSTILMVFTLPSLLTMTEQKRAV